MTAVASRSRAGTFLNYGDFEGGLAVVDRALVAAETALSGPDKAFATGTLHLRRVHGACATASPNATSPS